jgi:hypothetical protein
MFSIAAAFVECHNPSPLSVSRKKTPVSDLSQYLSGHTCRETCTVYTNLETCLYSPNCLGSIRRIARRNSKRTTHVRCTWFSTVDLVPLSRKSRPRFRMVLSRYVCSGQNALCGCVSWQSKLTYLLAISPDERRYWSVRQRIPLFLFLLHCAQN